MDEPKIPSVLLHIPGLEDLYSDWIQEAGAVARGVSTVANFLRELQSGKYLAAVTRDYPTWQSQSSGTAIHDLIERHPDNTHLIILHIYAGGERVARNGNVTYLADPAGHGELVEVIESLMQQNNSKRPQYSLPQQPQAPTQT